MKKPGAEHTAVRARGSVVDAWEHSLPDPTAPCFLIEDIYPCVDGGPYPVKRIAGECVEVWADIFREGHDVFAAALLWRPETSKDWRREPIGPYNKKSLARTFPP